MDSNSIRELFSIGLELVPRWLNCFKVLYYDHLLLCRTNAAWGIQWRYREKRNDQEYHEKVSFFHLAKFWMVFFVFEKISSSIPMLLFMLLAHVGNSSNKIDQNLFSLFNLSLLQRFVSSSNCKENIVALNWTVLVSNLANTFSPEAVARRFSVENVFLKNSQNS